MSSSSSTHPAAALLARAHPPDTAASIFSDRVQQRPLFLRPASPTAADGRERRRRARLAKKTYFLKHQRPRPLSARERRVSGLYKLEPARERKSGGSDDGDGGDGSSVRREVEEDAGTGTTTATPIPDTGKRTHKGARALARAPTADYAVFTGLHRLWTEYMWEALDLARPSPNGPVAASAGITPGTHGSRLTSADYHGARLTVVRSRCVSRIGLTGIVARETKFAFVLVTKNNRVKTVPKEHTVFRFEIALPPHADGIGEQAEGENKTTKKDSLVFELYGSQFENRPIDRTNKKFKWQTVVDL